LTGPTTRNPIERRATDEPAASEPAIEIQSASEIDFPSYAAFQKEAFRDLLARTKATDTHMTPETYRWKYHPPEGPARIARIIREGETLSSSAMLPLRISRKGKSIRAWHCLDVATLPKARRRGYFLASLRALKESVPADELFFAFPNASSIASFLKLGCVENRILTTWISPCASLARRRNASIEQIDRFDSRHDIVGTAIPIDGPCCSRRPDYLNWRYTDHPNNTYVSFAYGKPDCRGFCVVRHARIMNRDFALVMEVFGSTPGIQGVLLAHAADWAHRSGIGMMALMDTSLPWGIALKTLLAPVPSALLPKRQVFVLHGEGAGPRALMKEKWVLKTGDWDVF
jgi:hypothetical protein